SGECNPPLSHGTFVQFQTTPTSARARDRVQRPAIFRRRSRCRRMTPALPPHPPTDLRPYQRDAIDAVLAARRAGRRRLLVHLPTGAGKTVIFSHLARLARRQVLVLAHREELLTQAREQLL